MSKFDKVVTTALLYANGPLHLGHLVEHIQADIWVRFQRMQGKKCLFIGGNDAHGTPIMLSSSAANISPEELIKTISLKHQANLQQFNILYDQFSTTHSAANEKLTIEIFNTLKQQGLIETKQIEQPYDFEHKMFLPDRYIKGTCPKCGAKDQYGDNCEACGATYSATELINPISVLSNTAPVNKQSLHYFFTLSKCQTMLAEWIKSIDCNPTVINKLLEWFATGLQDWDISREAPYFGFKIPNEKDKYFYVWLDAPIGYIATCQEYCDLHNLELDSILGKNTNTEFIHFIGKDITYFHALFWPAILHHTRYKQPTAIFSHGFLTINNKKMSKSRKTFITADAYLEKFEPDYLRYYLCSKLSNKTEDIDLNWQDFKNKVDADLVGKITNIASRCAKLLHKNFDNKLASKLDSVDLYNICLQAGTKTATHFENRDFNKAVKEITTAAEQVNQYLAELAPWVLVKSPETITKAHLVCSQGIQCFRCLITYLKPITPDLNAKAEEFLNHQTNSWEECKQPLFNHTLNEFAHLITRISKESIQEFCTNE